MLFVKGSGCVLKAGDVNGFLRLISQICLEAVLSLHIGLTENYSYCLGWRQVFVYACVVLAVCVGYGVLPNSLVEHNAR